MTASDLTPALLDAGRAEAEARGLSLAWREADAEALPFAAASFDAVLSCVGVMFAPHHDLVADELVRVCRPGGRVGLISWTPAGFLGQLLATMKPYAPPPPPGARSAPLWGDEDHVTGLFGDRVEVSELRRGSVRVEHFAEPAEFPEYFRTYYGPVRAVYRRHAGDEGRVAALTSDLIDLVGRFDIGTDRTVMEWEYLLLVAARR